MQVTEASCDTLYAQISVFFPFGAGSTCPPLSGYAVLPGGATALISLYYDISGPWPTLGCTSTTTVAIPIPPGNVQVLVGTFNIAEGDTSAMVSDSLLQVCVLGLPDIAPNGHDLRIVHDELTWIQPLRSSGGSIEIIGNGGQLFRTCDVKDGRCWLGDLAPGVYLARWSSRSDIAPYRFVLD